MPSIAKYHFPMKSSEAMAAMIIAACSLCALGEVAETDIVSTSLLGNISNSSNLTKPHHAHHAHGHFPITHMAFPLVMIAAGAFCKQIKNMIGMPIPHTVLMFLIGFGCGLLNVYVKQDHPTLIWKQWTGSVKAIKDIDPHFLLSLFLPILLFESAFATKWHVFWRVIGPAVTLAVPGLIIGTALTAVYLMFMRVGTEKTLTSWQAQYDDFAWYRAIIFGAILSATDPVAVVAILKTLGAKKHLSVTIEGESLLNDGIACVVFYALKIPVEENIRLNVTQVVEIFFRMTFGGFFWGLFCGFVATFLISLAYDRPMVEITITICVAYLTFFIGEEMKVSGVLAIVTLGLWFSSYGHYYVTPSVMHDLHVIWDLLSFLGNSLLFSFSGVIIAYVLEQAQESHDFFDYSIAFRSPWLYFNFFTLYVALTLIRGLVLLMLYPILQKVAPKGYKMGVKDSIVSVWGALRGAVGLALAMFIALNGQVALKKAVKVCSDSCTVSVSTLLTNYTAVHKACEQDCVHTNHTNAVVLNRFGVHMMFSVGLLVICTLIINSMTMKPLLKCLKMTEISKQKKAIFNQAMDQLEEAVGQEISLLKQDPTLQCVNWGAVRKGRYTSDFVRLRSKGSQRMKITSKFASNLLKVRKKSIKKGSHEHQEARRRFLVAVRSAYNRQFKKAFINGRALRMLIEANDVALDKGCDVSVEWATICKAVPFLSVNTLILQIHAQLVLYSKVRIFWNFFKSGQLGCMVLFLHLITRENKLCNRFLLGVLHGWIQMACDVSSAYLSAREEACKVLEQNLGYEADLEHFKAATHADIHHARRALIHCHRLFPAITTSVKTHRALLVVLNIQKTETKRLLAAGALDQEEADKLVAAMDTYLQNKQNWHRFCPNLQIPTKASVLSEVPWLNGVDERMVNKVIENSTSEHFSLDDFVIESGKTVDHIYVIASGTVALVMENPDAKTPKFFIGSAGGYGQYKPGEKEMLLPDTVENENKRFHVHNQRDATFKRRQASQAGNLLLGFYGETDSVVDIAPGQTIGALSWINERRPSPYSVRATSSRVEVYKVPLDLIQADEGLQHGLWQSAGRSLAFEVVRKMGAYVYWTESSLREHISHWDVKRAFSSEVDNPDWFLVDFEVPVVLIQGAAIRVRVKRSSTPYFGHRQQEGDNTLTVITTKQELNVGGLPLQLTDEQLQRLMKDRHLPKKASPAFLLPCPPDDMIASSVDFWYVSKNAWVCAPGEAKWTVVDVASSTSTTKKRSLFRVVREMMHAGQVPSELETAMEILKSWAKSARANQRANQGERLPEADVPPSPPLPSTPPKARPRAPSFGSPKIIPKSLVNTLNLSQSSDHAVHNNVTPSVFKL